MKPLADCRLYTFVDAAYLHGRPPTSVAQQLCDGGADLLQLRAKSWPAEDVLRIAEQLLPITQAAGVWLVINDHPEIAWAVGAPLCHLGQEDFFDRGFVHTDQLRAALTPPARLRGSAAQKPPVIPASPAAPVDSTAAVTLGFGLSTHAPQQAERAVAADPAYVAIGPVYPTGTKPTARPVTLAYVRWAAGHLSLPWFAIGGITLQNLDEVLAAGARRVCVVSALLNAPDLADACQQWRQRLG